MDVGAAQRLVAASDPRGLANAMQRSGDPAVSKAVAQQFGALFMQGLMQQGDGSGIAMADGVGTGIVNNFFASTMGRVAMSGEKLGLTDLMLRSIEAKQRAADGGGAATVTTPAAAVPAADGTPAATTSGFPLTPYWQGNGLRPAGAGGHLRVPAPVTASGGPIFQVSLGIGAPTQTPAAAQTSPGPLSLVDGLASSSRSASAQQVAVFMQQLGPLLKQAGARLGVSPRVLLAQAAIETGWGRSVVGNNIFGIKAGSSWTGDIVTTATHEYEDGQYVSVNAAFRAYPTLDAAVRDFVSVVSASPRYRAALGAGEDAGAYARGLVAGGWATDIDYVQKLQSVASGPSATAAFAAAAAAAPPPIPLTAFR